MVVQVSNEEKIDSLNSKIYIKTQVNLNLIESENNLKAKIDTLTKEITHIQIL